VPGHAVAAAAHGSYLDSKSTLFEVINNFRLYDRVCIVSALREADVLLIPKKNFFFREVLLQMNLQGSEVKYISAK
jgi:hypothetical protein